MNAAGAFGFAKEGYPYHRFSKYMGLTSQDCGFTAKTTGMQRRLEPDTGLGNMPMKNDGITPKHWFPSCIIVKPFSGIVLNAVGLSGPGASDLLARGKWQKISDAPWNLSFMSVLSTSSDRLEELREFVKLLAPLIHQFNAPCGLEMNFSCPNAGLDPSSLINEVGQALDIAALLDIALQCKFNALAPVRAVCEICQHIRCAAVVIGNTIPWGKFSEHINWKSLFGSDISPLAHLGGGGLSGPPLCGIHCQWIREAQDCGISKPIWGCGGIDSFRAIEEYRRAGVCGIQIGTTFLTRPWRTKNLISYGNQLFS